MFPASVKVEFNDALWRKMVNMLVERVKSTNFKVSMLKNNQETLSRSRASKINCIQIINVDRGCVATK